MKLLFPMFILLGLSACTHKSNENVQPPIEDTVAEVDSEQAAYIDAALNLQLNNFSQIDTSGIFLFPLKMGVANRDVVSKNYKEIPQDYAWNYVFYNTSNNAIHPLTSDKILITNIGLNSTDSGYKRFFDEYIYYEAITTDYNNDKLFNALDPSYLYVSDRSGNDFKRISPAGIDVIHWRYFQNIHAIILTGRKDSDNNNVYDDSDEVLNYKIDIQNNFNITEIMPADLKKALKLQYDKYWQKVKS